MYKLIRMSLNNQSDAHQKLKISNSQLKRWVAQEQYDLDRMWAYLQQRSKQGVIKMKQALIKLF